MLKASLYKVGEVYWFKATCKRFRVSTNPFSKPKIKLSCKTVETFPFKGIKFVIEVVLKSQLVKKYIF